uniref:Uncharacterized protein n=1 Tax=Rhipicephalus zambeziensis TaxID=60191 RepID=A0A224YFA5_9ACAR
MWLSYNKKEQKNNFFKNHIFNFCSPFSGSKISFLKTMWKCGKKFVVCATVVRITAKIAQKKCISKNYSRDQSHWSDPCSRRASSAASVLRGHCSRKSRDMTRSYSFYVYGSAIIIQNIITLLFRSCKHKLNHQIMTVCRARSEHRRHTYQAYCSAYQHFGPLEVHRRVTLSTHDQA